MCMVYIVYLILFLFWNLYLLLLYEILDEIYCWLIVGEDSVLPGVVYRVVVLEGIAMLIHEEDAGHVALGKGVVVAIIGQLATF